MARKKQIKKLSKNLIEILFELRDQDLNPVVILQMLDVGF